MRRSQSRFRAGAVPASVSAALGVHALRTLRCTPSHRVAAWLADMGLASRRGPWPTAASSNRWPRRSSRTRTRRRCGRNILARSGVSREGALIVLHCAPPNEDPTAAGQIGTARPGVCGTLPEMARPISISIRTTASPTSGALETRATPSRLLPPLRRTSCPRPWPTVVVATPPVALAAVSMTVGAPARTHRRDEVPLLRPRLHRRGNGAAARAQWALTSSRVIVELDFIALADATRS